VQPQTAVALAISEGPQPVTVPNVVGDTQAAAESAITAATLTYTESQAYNSTVASGYVISQNPSSGTELPGQAVALAISEGPQPVTVPNVVGDTQAAAESAITAAGLTVGTEPRAYSSSVPSGQVISETPVAGTPELPGTAVALVISEGPQTFSVSGQISLVNGVGPLVGANVSLGSGLTATTDQYGDFTIDNVPSSATPYTLTPSFTFPAGSDPTDSSVFYPASQSLTVSGSDVTGENFTAQLGFTVSGTMTYTGAITRTSQLYLNLQNPSCGSCSPAGTSLLFTASGQSGNTQTFTIHGVTPGAYTLQSWFDYSGFGTPNLADPVSSGSPVSVSLATGDVSGVSVTLNDPAKVGNVGAAPTMVVSPAIDKGVIVYYKSIMIGGVEQAIQYNLNWSSITAGGGDTDCTASHPTFGGGLSLAAGDAFWEDSAKIIVLDGGDSKNEFYSTIGKNGGDGSTYSFCMQGINGADGTGAWTFQHVTLAAPPTTSPAGTSTLTVQYKTPVKAAGPVYAGCYDPVGNMLYVHTDESKAAAGTKTYTVYGIPSSVTGCNIVAAMDQNNEGFITPMVPNAGSPYGQVGDIYNLGRNNTVTPLNVGGTTSPALLDLTPYASNSSATLTTQHNLDPASVESYSLNFDVRSLLRLPVAVELTSGSNVLQPMDFAAGCQTCGQGEFNFTAGMDDQAPAIGGSYKLAIADETATIPPTTDTPTLTVSNVVNDFPTGLTASGGAAPTFTWSYPVHTATAYTYRFTLTDASGNVIWQIPAKTGTGFSSTAVSSIAWPTDPTGATNSPLGSLSIGTTYTWSIATIDQYGNTAQQEATYKF